MEDSLNRFVEAQKKYYSIALNEIKNGYKETHWIWFIFPQLKELGKSETALYFGILDLDEAKRYLENDFLRKNLMEISDALLKLKSNNPTEVLGYPDDLKVRSCMTLFYSADSSMAVFKKVIDKFYNGKFDNQTLAILKRD